MIYIILNIIKSLIFNLNRKIKSFCINNINNKIFEIKFWDIKGVEHDKIKIKYKIYCFETFLNFQKNDNFLSLFVK